MFYLMGIHILRLFFFFFNFIFRWVFSVARGHVTEPICKVSKSVVLALMGCARQKKQNVILLSSRIQFPVDNRASDSL